MAEEQLPPSGVRPQPHKAISERREEIQSRSLAALSLLAVLASIVFGLFASGDLGGRYQVTAVSLLFATLAVLLRSATLPGALSGALVCFCLTWWTRDLDQPLLHSALPALVLLFLLTFAATRSGRATKLARGLAEPKGGRTAAQVMANLSVAALVVTPAGAYLAALAGFALPISPLILSTASLAALAEATADTVSSEIGQAFGDRTYMLTSFRRVRRGTDGGVSLIGTSAGIGAAFLLVIIGAWPLHLGGAAVTVAFLAAVLGLFCDSLLGATLERRGWIGNDLVNFTSTAFAALTSLLLARLITITR